MKGDIKSTEDVKLMVDSFYEAVKEDGLLGPVFNDHAKVNWETHLPKMYNFWDTIIFARGDYKGSPFTKHASLPVSGLHFERWIELFHQTIDRHFQGEKAEEIKQRAHIIAWTFRSKMGLDRA